MMRPQPGLHEGYSICCHPSHEDLGWHPIGVVLELPDEVLVLGPERAKKLSDAGIDGISIEQVSDYSYLS